jgi:hypothetical protein
MLTARIRTTTPGARVGSSSSHGRVGPSIQYTEVTTTGTTFGGKGYAMGVTSHTYTAAHSNVSTVITTRRSTKQPNARIRSN